MQREKTEFAKRNPFLEKLVPDAIENAVDAIMPDQLEKVRACEWRLVWMNRELSWVAVTLRRSLGGSSGHLGPISCSAVFCG